MRRFRSTLIRVASPSNLLRFAQISFYENKAQYQNTFLGLWWIPISTLLFTSVLVFVFAAPSEITLEAHMLYVLSGYCMWLMISETITQSTNTIQTQLDFADHNNMSLADLFLKNTFDKLFRFTLNCTLPFLLISYLAVMGNIELYTPIHAIPLFLVLTSLSATASISTSLIVNVMCVLLPDLERVIHTAIRFLFFLSPVFWFYSSTDNGFRSTLVAVNPVTYWLEIARQTFGVSQINLLPWLICLAMTIVALASAIIAHAITSRFLRNMS